uniref:Glycosyltransferase n=1 Tax=Ignisphaera aggregans TaxID=334771 RepID=A0A7J3YU20_9CREN
MKILLIAKSIDKPGGAGRLEAYLAKALAELGYNGVIISPTHPHIYYSSLLPKHIKIYTLQELLLVPPSIPLLDYILSLKFVEPIIIRIIEKEMPQVIISSGGLLKSIAKKASDIEAKIAVYYHMIMPWYIETRGFYRKYRWSDLSMLWFGLTTALSLIKSIDFDPWSYADIVIVNSKYMAHLAKRYWNIEPYVLQPPIELKNFIPPPREERRLEVLSIGRLNPDKRYEDLIEAIGKKDTLRSSIMIKLAGALSNERYVKSLLKLAKKYGVRVSIKVNVSEEEKRELLSKSLIFVNCSKHEHFGISIIEAMAYGTPVIVHRSGGPYFDITDRGIYGLTYADVDELAYNIELLVEDYEAWMKYSELALYRAKFYDFNSFKLRLSYVLSKLLGEGIK